MSTSRRSTVTLSWHTHHVHQYLLPLWEHLCFMMLAVRILYTLQLYSWLKFTSDNRKIWASHCCSMKVSNIKIYCLINCLTWINEVGWNNNKKKSLKGHRSLQTWNEQHVVIFVLRHIFLIFTEFYCPREPPIREKYVILNHESGPCCSTEFQQTLSNMYNNDSLPPAIDKIKTGVNVEHFFNAKQDCCSDYYS